MSRPWRIEQDDLSGADIRRLLNQHFAEMLANSPEGSCHFLDVDGLKADGVTFWSVWDGDSLAGCGALKRIDAHHGEVKSMRVADEFRGTGAGHAILCHIIAAARSRGYGRLSLETGTGPAFTDASRLYLRAGFTDREPFADYRLDPFSRYMSKTLD